ncbi:unnamed protein product [Amoebophrya sp. A120]|nr:unnamed protein product [Amoebophrya sp. A120]|eukprot:GSA120T00001897001.1
MLSAALARLVLLGFAATPKSSQSVLAGIQLPGLPLRSSVKESPSALVTSPPVVLGAPRPRPPERETTLVAQCRGSACNRLAPEGAARSPSAAQLEMNTTEVGCEERQHRRTLYTSRKNFYDYAQHRRFLILVHKLAQEARRGSRNRERPRHSRQVQKPRGKPWNVFAENANEKGASASTTQQVVDKELHQEAQNEKVVRKMNSTNTNVFEFGQLQHNDRRAARLQEPKQLLWELDVLADRIAQRIIFGAERSSEALPLHRRIEAPQPTSRPQPQPQNLGKFFTDNYRFTHSASTDVLQISDRAARTNTEKSAVTESKQSVAQRKTICVVSSRNGGGDREVFFRSASTSEEAHQHQVRDEDASATAATNITDFHAKIPISEFLTAYAIILVKLVVRVGQWNKSDATSPSRKAASPEVGHLEMKLRKNPSRSAHSSGWSPERIIVPSRRRASSTTEFCLRPGSVLQESPREVFRVAAWVADEQVDKGVSRSAQKDFWATPQYGEQEPPDIKYKFHPKNKACSSTGTTSRRLAEVLVPPSSTWHKFQEVFHERFVRQVAESVEKRERPWIARLTCLVAHHTPLTEAAFGAGEWFLWKQGAGLLRTKMLTLLWHGITGDLQVGTAQEKAMLHAHVRENLVRGHNFSPSSGLLTAAEQEGAVLEVMRMMIFLYKAFALRAGRHVLVFVRLTAYLFLLQRVIDLLAASSSRRGMMWEIANSSILQSLFPSAIDYSRLADLTTLARHFLDATGTREIFHSIVEAATATTADLAEVSDLLNLY